MKEADMRLSPAQAPSRPGHVPAHLALDFDMYHLPEEFSDDPHAYWKSVQDSYPSIFWTPAYGGHWVVTRGEDIKAIASAHEQFSSREPIVPRGTQPWMVPWRADPPQHALYRKILMPAFAPRAVMELEKKARSVAIEIIEELRPRGECEFVTEFSGIMPIIALLNLLGLPESDQKMLRGWAKMMTPVTNPKCAEGWGNITRYVQGWIKRRKAGPAEGLIADIVRAEINGKPMDDDDILAMCQLVVSGGLDTVVIMTSFTARYLALNPCHRQYLRENPDKLANAVEEFARRFGTSNLAREVREDLVYKDVSMCKGEQVVVPYPLYGLDETINSNPMEVDFNRDSFKHSAFGAGPHTCIGAALARREIKIFLEEWLTRIPDFTIKAGTRPFVTTGTLNSISDLQFEWPVANQT